MGALLYLAHWALMGAGWGLAITTAILILGTGALLIRALGVFLDQWGPRLGPMLLEWVIYKGTWTVWDDQSTGYMVLQLVSKRGIETRYFTRSDLRYLDRCGSLLNMSPSKVTREDAPAPKKRRRGPITLGSKITA